jgi:hypothetical protein
MELVWCKIIVYEMNLIRLNLSICEMRTQLFEVNSLMVGDEFVGARCVYVFLI